MIGGVQNRRRKKMIRRRAKNETVYYVSRLVCWAEQCCCCLSVCTNTSWRDGWREDMGTRQGRDQLILNYIKAIYKYIHNEHDTFMIFLTI